VCDAHEPLAISVQTVSKADPSQRVLAVPEVATGEDGSIFVFFFGVTFEGESPQLGGFVTIDPDGDVSDLEPIRDPFSESDPGSPGHHGVRPATSIPWLVFVDTDGVRVFTRLAGSARYVLRTRRSARDRAGPDDDPAQRA